MSEKINKSKIKNQTIHLLLLILFNKSFYRETFAGLKSLRELKIEYNDLTKIHSLAFNSLVNLQIINFKNNQLKNNLLDHITNQISPFYSCHQLKQLDLSYNKFTKMINWTQSYSLENLDLSHNLITSVSVSFFFFFLQLSDFFF